MWYTMTFKGDVQPDYTSTVAPSMTPERMLLYEVFILLKTHVCDTSRVTITKTWVGSVKDKVTTDLKRKRLESQINDTLVTSADGILASLEQVYAQSINKEPLDDADQDYEDNEREEQVESLASSRQQASSSKREKVTKKEMHPLMGKDIRKLGFAALEKKGDVVAVRAEADRRREEKCQLRTCIMHHLQNQSAHTDVQIDNDIEYMPTWQRYVRSRPNNLGLTF